MAGEQVPQRTHAPHPARSSKVPKLLDSIGQFKNVAGTQKQHKTNMHLVGLSTPNSPHPTAHHYHALNKILAMAPAYAMELHIA
jgi:hypothetical protein